MFNFLQLDFMTNIHEKVQEKLRKLQLICHELYEGNVLHHKYNS